MSNSTAVLQDALEDAGFETERLDHASERAGAVWECKIGVLPDTTVMLPGGSDAPMREAVEKAFKDVTGIDARFCFSGWGAELTEGEQLVVDEDDT